MKPIDGILEAKALVGTALRERNNNLELFGRAGHVRAGMYSHYYFTDQKTNKKFWIKFCREPFLTFSKQFREHGNTIGETIDLEIIKDVLTDTDEVYFVYPDAVYYIDVKTIRAEGRDRINDQDGSHTISFDIKLLKRYI